MLLVAFGLARPVAADCGGDFSLWIQALREEARGSGISESVLRLLDGIKPDKKVLALDRSQRVFTQTWLTFAGRMVNAYRLKTGRCLVATCFLVDCGTSYSTQNPTASVMSVPTTIGRAILRRKAGIEVEKYSRDTEMHG